MNSLRYKSQVAKSEAMDRSWFVIDATDKTVGRLASQVASILRGKNKPSYTPHVDCGDYVVITNADKVKFTGRKWKQKTYLTYSGYTGGQKSKTAEEMMEKFPDRVLYIAIKGMLPKTKLGRQMIKKLFVYADESHPHHAQKPQLLEL